MANIEDRVINVGFIAAFMAAGYVLFTLFRRSAADGACDALSSIYCSLTGGTAVRDVKRNVLDIYVCNAIWMIKDLEVLFQRQSIGE